MFRTRDFVLIFSVIMFLVMAIGTTLVSQGWSKAKPLVYTVSPENNTEYTATVAGSDELTRTERVAQMRAKISQQAILTKEVIEDEVTEEQLEADVATTTDELADVAGVIQCPRYQEYGGFWDARDLNWIEREGARVLARGDVTATTSTDIVVQLPLRPLPAGNPSCLGSDVIGIANDGSLIRNDEVALYSIFDAETVIGYALDGFPIYGAAAGEVDACGGMLAFDGYRYQLAVERATIINCFAGAPVNLP